MMLLWIAASALAGDLNFSPDRPGIGDSTGSVGQGHAMIEGGLTGFLGNGFSGGSLGVMGRIGVIDPLEVRVRAPSLNLGAGFGVGPVGVGAKYSADLSSDIAVSVVPELTLGLPNLGPGFSLGGNLTFAAGDVSPWLHATINLPVSAVVGGGVGVAIGNGGAYGNAGLTLGGGAVAPMVGAGGWLGLRDALQIDFGLDVVVSPILVLQPLFGISGGF